MKQVGFFLLIVGGVLILIYTFYHLIAFMLTKSWFLLMLGLIIAFIGLVFLLVSALLERSKKEDFKEVDK